MDSIFNSKTKKEEVQSTQKERVLQSLINLNSKIKDDNRKIKLLVFFYSKFSEKSSNLLSSIPEECKSLFYYISVDNPKIRSRLLTSKKISIREVPSILMISIDDSVSTFEGPKTIDLLKNFLSLLTPPPPPAGFEKQKRVGFSTPLSSVLGNKQRVHPSSFNEENVIEDISDIKHVKNVSKIEDINTSIDRLGMKRKKEEDNEVKGISSLRNRPVKGIGHEKMAHSSLSSVIDMGEENPPPKSTNNNLGMDIIEDIDDIENMENEIDTEELLGVSVDKKESMDNIKKAALEMQKMREVDLK